PSRLAGERSQRVQHGPARLVDGDDGRVVGKPPVQPRAIRRSRPGKARQEYQDDGETDDQLGCAHVRSPFVREYERAPGLFGGRRVARGGGTAGARARGSRERPTAADPGPPGPHAAGGPRATPTPIPAVHRARSAAASASHATRPAGSVTVATETATAASPTS